MGSMLLLGAGGGSPGSPAPAIAAPSSATIPTGGATLSVVFSAAVTGFSTGAEGFALTGLSGGATTLTYASGNGTTTIVFTVSRTVSSSETGGKLAYTAGDITTVSSGEAVASFTNFNVTNSSTQVAATFSSATIQTNGTSLNVVYSAAVTGFSSGAEGHALTGLSGGATTLTYASGEGTATIVFTISRTVQQGETGGVLAYAPGDILTNSNSLAVAAYSNQAVTNNSTQTAPAVRNVSTGTGTAGSSAVTLPTRSSGDILVAFIADPDNTLPAANTNWTRVIDQANSAASAGRLGVYWRTSDGTDNTPFSAVSTSNYAYIVFSVRNPTTGYDTSAGGTAGSGTTIVAPTVSAGGAPAILLSGYLLTAALTVTPPGGQTATTQVAIPSTASGLVCGYESLAVSGATGTRTATNASTAAAHSAASVIVR